MLKSTPKAYISLLLFVLLIIQPCFASAESESTSSSIYTFTVNDENPKCKANETKTLNTPFYICYRNQLDSEEAAIYDAISANIDLMRHDKANRFEIPLHRLYHHDNKQETEQMSCSAYNAMSAFIYDNPELFWLTREYGLGYTYNNSTKEISRLYLYANLNTDSWHIADFQSQAALDSAEAEFNAAISSVVSEVKSLAPYAKVRYIYNYVMRNCTYNPYIKEGEQPTRFIPFCAYSGIVKQSDEHNYPVCEGYAKAFVVLCRAAGFSECINVCSETHMWAAIRMHNGVWYYADPTADDSGYVPTYYYFLRGISMDKTHKPSGYIESRHGYFNYPEISRLDYPLSLGDSLGDCNGSGGINTFDAVEILRFAAGASAPESSAKQRYDFNTDGNINTADAVMILRFLTQN